MTSNIGDDQRITKISEIRDATQQAMTKAQELLVK
jgi:hypothetical protein